MPEYRLMVNLLAASGTPQDGSTNVWHCTADDLTAAQLFLGEVYNVYTAVDGMFSNLVSPTGGTMKLYDLADPEPRAPVHTEGMGTLTVGGAPLPTECALVLSFQGVRVSGVQQARRRGRIYFGPIQQSANGSDGRPSSSTISGLVVAAQALLDASDAAATWSWAVYSRTDSAMVTVSDGWVDNEWDTQRRRGRAATTRSRFQL